MNQQELATRSATLKEVRLKLKEVREGGSKRLGFARAEQVVMDMQLELLDELGKVNTAESKPPAALKAS